MPYDGVQRDGEGYSLGGGTQKPNPEPDSSSSSSDSDVKITIINDPYKSDGTIAELKDQIKALQDQVNQLQTGSAQRVVSGKTSPNDWLDYASSAGIVVHVDLQHHQFINTPICTSAIHGTSHHWSTTGGSSIYSLTKDGFFVYIRYTNDASNAQILSDAKSLGWHIQYICVSQDM